MSHLKPYKPEPLMLVIDILHSNTVIIAVVVTLYAGHNRDHCSSRWKNPIYITRTSLHLRTCALQTHLDCPMSQAKL